MNPVILDTTTEDEAISLFHAMCKKYGWTGTVFTRADVEDLWTSEDTDLDQMSDEAWATVQRMWGWKRLFDNDFVMESLWNMITDAVADAKAELLDTSEKV